MTLHATIKHNGTVYAAEHMVIESTELGRREDFGYFTGFLHVQFRGFTSAIGGYLIDGNRNWVTRTIETVIGQYGAWEDLRGRHIFGLYRQGEVSRASFLCEGIASIDGERVFIFDGLIP